MSRSPDIRVTLGRCDDMRAEVFVRLEGGEERGVLEGTITGPRRGRDVTLPSTTRLVPLPAATGATPVSRAILTEPAFWTPDLPNLYRVEATSRDAAQGATVAFDASVGLRRLGVRGRSFWLDGRRWVPRAIATDLAAAAAREAGVGLLVTSPTEQLLAAADEMGVAVVAVLGSGEVSPARIASLARHPSAMLAIMTEPPVDEDALSDLHRLAGTLQFGLAVEGTAPPPHVPNGIDFLAVVLGEADVPHAGWRIPPPRPLLAWRQGDAAARSDCDLLQRELARWGVGTPSAEPVWDWAGYLVGGSDHRDRLGA